SSGGLTIDNSTAENNATIYTISESPRDGDVIWVGTDDGYVQVTENGGATWRNVTAAIPGVPEGTWVSRVTASPHDRAAAWVTFDGHRTGDMATYVYRTTDLGRTWERLPTDGVEGYAWVIVEDPERPGLLYLGTEFGLWISLDGGASWARFEGGIPKRVAVHDIVVHPDEADLIVATHGRGIYILDDLTPLRALTPEVLEEKAALLPSRPARMVTPAQVQEWVGDDEFVGDTPEEAAAITFWQKRRHLFGDLKVEVYGPDGERIATLPAPKRKGLNRVSWPMRLKPPKVPPASSLIPAFLGPRVPEGTYTVKLIKGKDVLEGTVTLVADPRSPHSAEDRKLQQETALALYRDLERLAYTIDTVIQLRDAARERAEGAPKRLARRLEAYADELEAFRASLVATGEGGMLSGEEKLREKLGELYGAVSGYDGRPTGSQLERKARLERELEAAAARFAGLTGERLADLNRRLERRGLAPLEVQTREAWEAAQE
ncbi:MAG: glycosyl hydrolase, partial [Nitrospirae bacterium]